MSIKLRVLRYVIAVAEEGGFERAAARLHTAQPPLSRQILALERELGVQLFERRPTRLTEAGRIFVMSARRVLAEADTMVTRTVQAGTSTVRLGYVATAAFQTVPRLLDALITAAPGIRVEAREGWSSDLELAVRERRLDFALLYGIEPSTGLAGEVIRRERFFAVVSATHRHAGRKALTLRDLRGETLSIFGRHLAPEHHDFILSALHRTGEKFNIQEALIFGLQNLPLADGHSFTALPESASKYVGRDFVGIPLLDDLPPMMLTMLWATDIAGDAAQTFLKTARKLAATES